MAVVWVVTKDLQAFREQMNRAFPNRDKKSDGTIGNLAHQKESASGHNPDITGAAEYRDGDNLNEVRAIDVDSDTGNPQVSMEDIVQHLLKLARAGKLPVIRYMIYNRRLWAASTGWKQESYSGASPHTEHLHLSGAYSQAADNAADFDYHLDDLVGDDDMTQAEFNSWLDAWWVARLSSGAKDNPQRTALRLAPWQQTVGRTGKTTHDVLFNGLAQLLAASHTDDVDEEAIAAGVLAGLNYQQIASAVATAVPKDQAQQVVNELSARLSSTAPTG